MAGIIAIIISFIGFFGALFYLAFALNKASKN